MSHHKSTMFMLDQLFTLPFLFLPLTLLSSTLCAPTDMHDVLERPSFKPSDSSHNLFGYLWNPHQLYHVEKMTIKSTPNLQANFAPHISENAYPKLTKAASEDLDVLKAGTDTALAASRGAQESNHPMSISSSPMILKENSANFPSQSVVFNDISPILSANPAASVPSQSLGDKGSSSFTNREVGRIEKGTNGGLHTPGSPRTAFLNQNSKPGSTYFKNSFLESDVLSALRISQIQFDGQALFNPENFDPKRTPTKVVLRKDTSEERLLQKLKLIEASGLHHTSAEDSRLLREAEVTGRSGSQRARREARHLRASEQPPRARVIESTGQNQGYTVIPAITITAKTTAAVSLDSTTLKPTESDTKSAFYVLLIIALILAVCIPMIVGAGYSIAKRNRFYRDTNGGDPPVFGTNNTYCGPDLQSRPPLYMPLYQGASYSPETGTMPLTPWQPPPSKSPVHQPSGL